MKRTLRRDSRLASFFKKGHIVWLLPFLLLVLLLVTACGSPTSGTTSTSTGTALKKPGRQSTATALAQSLGPYVPALKSQLAQGLHLTTTQLTQKVQAGQTLTSIASAQGLSSTQLSTLIASALSTSLAPSIKAGKLTQNQLQKLTQRLQKDPNQLDPLLAKETA
jgi:hypothetical protein